MGQNVPTTVRQTMRDSCWAAVLESWSRSDPRMRQGLQQQALIDQWGNRLTGGINPTVIQEIVNTYTELRFPPSFRYLSNYLQGAVDRSYIFCASHVPGTEFMHAVLVYGINRNNMIQTMDPDRGRLHLWSIDDFCSTEREPHMVMQLR